MVRASVLPSHAKAGQQETDTQPVLDDEFQGGALAPICFQFYIIMFESRNFVLVCRNLLFVFSQWPLSVPIAMAVVCFQMPIARVRCFFQMRATMPPPSPLVRFSIHEFQARLAAS